MFAAFMNHRNSEIFIYIFLGLLTAFGPFVTDMYLPALPSMTGFFNTTIAMVQLGLTFSMIGLAAGQLVWGPLSDKLGRRTPLLASMALFLTATAACIAAPSIEVFLALRLLQGLAASGGLVISRSIATDKFNGKELAKALAIVGAINGIAPVTAPVVGGFCTEKIGWQGIFVILLAIGTVITIMCIRFCETLEKERRSAESLAGSLKLLKLPFANRTFVLYALQVAMAQGILFCNIASSPFIIQEHYGCSALVFSFCFAINSAAIGIGAAMSVRFSKQENCVLASCAGMLAGSAIVAFMLFYGVPLAVYETAVTLLCFAMGMTFTASTALGMDAVRDCSGAGSAIFGAGGFLVGGVTAALVGIGDIMISSAVIFVCSAVLSGTFALLAVRSGKTPAGNAADSAAAA